MALHAFRGTFGELIALIHEPNRTKCYQLFENNRERFTNARGSKSKHQAWPGGYIDHLTEVMNIAVMLYDRLTSLRTLPFSLSDALLVLFLHDLEKPWKYAEVSGGEESSHVFVPELRDKDSQASYRLELIREYEIHLTDDQQNALKYVEGEGQDWDPNERKMGRLGAFCHMCDVASARLWYDRPCRLDEWGG